MAFVLADRIVQPILVSVYVLSPVFTVFSTENPTLILLCFNDKDAIYGYDNMVYLRCFVFAWNRDIVEDAVLIFWKLVQQF